MKKKPFVIPACVAGGLVALCLGAYGLLSWFGSPLVPGSRSPVGAKGRQPCL